MLVGELGRVVVYRHGVRRLQRRYRPFRYYYRPRVMRGVWRSRLVAMPTRYFRYRRKPMRCKVICRRVCE